MRLRRALLLLPLLARPAPGRAQRRTGKPEPLAPEKEAAPPPPPKQRLGAGTLGDLAPVPNRALEGPVVIAPDDSPTLAPSIIQRRLPGRGLAAEGSPSLSEDRLFEPAPGARLTVPFKY